jgi:hypothetical protein
LARSRPPQANFLAGRVQDYHDSADVYTGFMSLLRDPGPPVTDRGWGATFRHPKRRVDPAPEPLNPGQDIVDNPQADPIALIDRLFPEPALTALCEGDPCTLDGDPRPHRIAAIQGDMAVVYLAALPSATYRRVRLDDCIGLPDEQTA